MEESDNILQHQIAFEHRVVSAISDKCFLDYAKRYITKSIFAETKTYRL